MTFTATKLLSFEEYLAYKGDEGGYGVRTSLK